MVIVTNQCNFYPKQIGRFSLKRRFSQKLKYSPINTLNHGKVKGSALSGETFENVKILKCGTSGVSM